MKLRDLVNYNNQIESNSLFQRFKRIIKSKCKHFVQGLNPGKAIAEIKKLLANVSQKPQPDLAA